MSLTRHRSMLIQAHPFGSEKCPRRPACLAPKSSNGPHILPMTHDTSACTYRLPAPASLSSGRGKRGQRLTRCRHLCRLPEANPVLPMVFEARPRAHDRTLLRRAELGDAAVLHLRHTASNRALGCTQSLSQVPPELTSMLSWLKKSTAAPSRVRETYELASVVVGARGCGDRMDLLLTASHSFKSSPSGRTTARRRLPEPSL